MPDIAVPRTRADLTPEWMTEALGSGGYLDGQRVTAVQTEDIGVGRGYITSTLLLTLTFDAPAPEAPSEVVAKVASGRDGGGEYNSFIDGLQASEVRWYRDFGGECPVRIPRHYWGGLDPSARAYCLLLDYLPGLTESDQATGSTVEQAELVVTGLAKVHAQWWESEQLRRRNWLITSEAHAERARARYVRAWDSFERLYGKEFPAEFKAAGERIGPALPALYAAGTASATTLLHGDFRIENFMFGEPGSADELVILDWQFVGAGSGGRDLAYFLAQSLTTDVRRANEERLVRLYHDALISNGVTGYGFDSCLVDYHRGLLIGMWFPVQVAENVEQQGPILDRTVEELRPALAARFKAAAALNRSMYERGTAAILDNDVLVMLDDLD
jgi:hypothetical protein